jgi:phosphoribosylglycinamide formyltransferase-1
MSAKINIGVLISGRGSNMEALIRACAAPDYPARIVTVISNRSDAPGLIRAAQTGIPATAIPHRNFPSAAAFEDALHNHLIQHDVQLVCLAGFMKILSAGFVRNWTDRILNIHPSLLPDYPGLQPQARALADGKNETGCSVHIVIPEMDAGPVLVQRRVPILPGDDEPTLTARILEQEHLAYPEAVQLYAQQLLNPSAALEYNNLTEGDVHGHASCFRKPERTGPCPNHVGGIHPFCQICRSWHCDPAGSDGYFSGLGSKPF